MSAASKTGAAISVECRDPKLQALACGWTPEQRRAAAWELLASAAAIEAAMREVPHAELFSTEHGVVLPNP